MSYFVIKSFHETIEKNKQEKGNQSVLDWDWHDITIKCNARNWASSWILKGSFKRHSPSWTWMIHYVIFRSVQSLSCVRLFANPWITARQASLSITNSRSLLKLNVHRIDGAIQLSHPIIPFSSCLQSFPASGSFQMSQFFPSGDQSIGVSASAPVLPMNIQDWFPLGWTGFISLLSKRLSRVFSNTTVQKHSFFGAQLS